MHANRNLAALLAEQEREQLTWALLVQHADGSVELHGWDGNATVVFDRAETEEAMAESLLLPDPVACGEAVAAGVYPLNDCARCVGAAAPA